MLHREVLRHCEERFLRRSKPVCAANCDDVIQVGNKTVKAWIASSQKTLLAMTFCCLLSTAAFSAPLSPTEMQLRDYVNQHQNEQRNFLKKIVNINSGTANVTGVNRVGGILVQELKRLGFQVRMVSEPKFMHRAKTIVAVSPGQSAKHILIIAHLDTVFAKNSTFKRFELKKQSAKGPGIADDKGGLAVIVYALKALQSAHQLKNTYLTIVVTGDEEDSGKPTTISRQPLIEVAKGTDIALDFEPTMTMDTATIARRGISMWRLETTGNEAHSASIFNKDVGDGAIFELARILNTMRETLQHEQYLTFNPGLIVAGTDVSINKNTAQGRAFGKDNVIAKLAIATGDLRFISEDQKKSAQEKMIAIVQQPLAGTHAAITFQEGIPAMPPTDASLKLLEQYSSVSADLGQGKIKAFDPGARGAGDISHIAAIVPARLSGLGTLGYGVHSENEHVELASLPIQTARAAILIYRLSH
jgi:glutamate carboxypeptidase